MIEFGAALKVQRIDGSPIEDNEAKKLEREMKVLVRQRQFKGADGERLLCEYFETAHQSAIFQMTSSYIYAVSPEDMADESFEEDQQQARKLADILGIRYRGVYQFEVTARQW
jgi:hypothetical protein